MSRNIHRINSFRVGVVCWILNPGCVNEISIIFESKTWEGRVLEMSDALDAKGCIFNDLVKSILHKEGYDDMEYPGMSMNADDLRFADGVTMFVSDFS